MDDSKLNELRSIPRGTARDHFESCGNNWGDSEDFGGRSRSIKKNMRPISNP